MSYLVGNPEDRFSHKVAPIFPFYSLLPKDLAVQNFLSSLHLKLCCVAAVESLPIHHLGLVMRKPAFRICESKDADQLRGNREADQRLCFRYTDSTIPLLSESEISSL